ncbi:MAG: hypothetical protein WA982_13950 [Rubrobacteraceae bacterium]
MRDRNQVAAGSWARGLRGPPGAFRGSFFWLVPGIFQVSGLSFFELGPGFFGSCLVSRVLLLRGARTQQREKSQYGYQRGNSP